MPKRKCTGANCPMQVGCVVPETCPEPEKCRYATFPQTNADRIRNMTDEELAEVLADFVVRQGCSPVLQKLWRNSGAETLWRKHDDKENS